jgi:hypothetical protein
MNSPVSGWQRDPTARHEYRYWDGSRWTDDVSDRGVTSTDPMPGPGAMGPMPGPGADPTQVIDPTQSYPMAPTAPPAPTQSYGQPGAGYPQDGAPGFGPYGTLPNQPGSYGSYGQGGVPPVPTPQPDSGAKTGLFVGIGVLVLAVVGVGAFLLTKDDDNSDETSTLPLSEQTDPGSDTTDSPLTTTDPGDSGDTGDSGDSSDTGDLGSLGDLENVDPSDISEDMVVRLLAEELVNSGGLTEEQATCVSEALFDQVTIEELIEIGESGDVMGTLTPEQLNGLAESISDCGVV